MVVPLAVLYYCCLSKVVMHCCLACEQLTFLISYAFKSEFVESHIEVPPGTLLGIEYLPECLALHGSKGVCLCLIVLMPVHCTALQQTYLVGYVLCMAAQLWGMPMCRQKSRDIEVDLWRFEVSSKT